jgi:hypothetical protein
MPMMAMTTSSSMVRLGLLTPPCKRCREDYSLAGDRGCGACADDLRQEAVAEEAAAGWDAAQAAADTPECRVFKRHSEAPRASR